jgi:hypothetical protein
MQPPLYCISTTYINKTWRSVSTFVITSGYHIPAHLLNSFCRVWWKLWLNKICWPVVFMTSLVYCFAGIEAASSCDAPH